MLEQKVTGLSEVMGGDQAGFFLWKGGVDHCGQGGGQVKHCQSVVL